MPRTAWGWEITPDELSAWILHLDEYLLVVNKPAHVLCHPSKHGPWSSLVGACREYLGADRLHMPSRLDRESSGVVVLARDARLASRLQRAVHHRQVRKVYHAILCGELSEAITVDQPVGKHMQSEVMLRRAVAPDGQSAQTLFEPVAHGAGFTLARIAPRTGRLHQIRVHANWIGHPVAGDKIYGPDERLFLEFIQSGWGVRHSELLAFERQALHASEWSFPPFHFTAPLPAEWQPFLEKMSSLCQ